MYEQVFNFNSRPFTATPFVKHYFAADSIQQALEQSRICIDRGSGPAIVIGGAGTGKTLLLAILEEQYRSQLNVVNLGCARLGERSELLQSVLFELQLPYKNMSETELRFSLIDYLKPSQRCPNGILLLVDEAHTLSTELVDEVRLITNFVRDGEPRVRLIMAGNQQLEENLNEPKLESFNQRIAARCYLQNMSRDETACYVVEHVDRAGGEGHKLFDEASLKAIHEVSDGCPRLVNQVCDQVLILTATQGRSEVTDNCIHEAWADVQSIPGSLVPPTNRSSETSELTGDESWTVIEFGQLDETEDEAQSSEALSDSQLAADAHEFSELLESFAEEDELASDETSSESDSTTIAESEEQALEESVVEEPACPGEPIELEVPDDERGELSSVDQRLGGVDALEKHLSEMETENGAADSNETEFETGIQAEHDSIVKAAVESLADDDADESHVAEETQVACEEPASELENCEITDQLDANLNEDGVAESEPVETEEGQAVDTVDPFSESFEEEEYVVDRYSPFVAHHNQSSLSVTSDDLALIQPMGEVDEDSRPAVYQTEGDNPFATDGEFEEERSVDSLQESVDEAGVQFSTDEAVAESPNAEDTVGPQLEEEPMLDDVVPEPLDAGNNEDGGDHDPSTDVEQQAEEILQRLGVSCETVGVDESTDAEAANEQSSIPVLVGSATNLTDQNSDFDMQTAALEETQQILNEILEQKNLLALQQDEIEDECEDSVADSSSQLDAETTDDEREMIVVNRMDEPADLASPQEESIPFPTTPVSTGRAQRMDYQKLFEQLRDASNPET